MVYFEKVKYKALKKNKIFTLLGNEDLLLRLILQKSKTQVYKNWINPETNNLQKKYVFYLSVFFFFSGLRILTNLPKSQKHLRHKQSQFQQCQTIQLLSLNIKVLILNKLESHSNSVLSVCFSPDGNTLASDSNDKSILLFLWDVKTGQQIQSSNNRYIAKFRENARSPFYKTTLLQSLIVLPAYPKRQIFLSQGALVLKGQFVNYSSFDLKFLLKSKGSSFLKSLLQK